MEIWASEIPAPRSMQHVAPQVEAAGYNGMNVVDSQNLAPDCFVGLTVAAMVTTKLKLGTGVANTVTRVPATLAAAAASVQMASKGRMTLGVGRGDSALAHIGRSPSRLKPFGSYLAHLKTYLTGGDIPMEELDEVPDRIAPPVAELALAHAPDASRLNWSQHLQDPAPTVPLEVAATGPKVIAIAACIADRVMFALGADPERVAWGIETAKAARTAAGLDPDAILFGAYVPTACHPDMDTARMLVKGALTVSTRFSVMHGKTAGPLPEGGQQVMDALRNGYDMTEHTKSTSAQADTLTPDYIDAYAAAGRPDRVIERYRALKALGITKIAVHGIRHDAKQGGVAREALEMFEREVLGLV